MTWIRDKGNNSTTSAEDSFFSSFFPLIWTNSRRKRLKFSDFSGREPCLVWPVTAARVLRRTWDSPHCLQSAGIAGQTVGPTRRPDVAGQPGNQKDCWEIREKQRADLHQIPGSSYFYSCLLYYRETGGGVGGWRGKLIVYHLHCTNFVLNAWRLRNSPSALTGLRRCKREELWSQSRWTKLGFSRTLTFSTLSSQQKTSASCSPIREAKKAAL